jgi:HPt (histidine-containing phosphotransfer) domain-containing protein
VRKTLNDFLSSGDMHNFSIGVHSMKGCLANIGAMELSSRAYELETAADRADKDYCASHLPPFMEDLHGLSLSLTAAFEGNTQTSNSDPIEVPPALLAILKKIAAAIAKTDFAAIDKAMESLDALKENGVLKEGTPLNEEIEKIKDAILMMDYETAEKTIQTLI